MTDIMQHYAFFDRYHVSKTRPARLFVPLFALFLLPPLLMHPSTPIRINLHPSTTICFHFSLISQNMMSGEISPAISTQKYPAISFFCSVYLVFAFPCVSCTHTHPSAPVHNHFHLFVPVCTLN